VIFPKDSEHLKIHVMEDVTVEDECRDIGTTLI
jgi:hypothetical protein